MKVLSGLGVAMITPFNSKAAIDYVSLQHTTEHLINSGSCEFLVVLGTTAETPTLSLDRVYETVKCLERSPARTDT